MAQAIASGVVTAPAAGAAICTLAAPAAGVYEVEITAGVSGAAAADLGNMRLRRGGVDLMSPIPSGASGQQEDTKLEEVALDGAQTLTVEAIGIGTAAIEYQASIVVNRK